MAPHRPERILIVDDEADIAASEDNPTHCRRCGIEFEDANPPVECPSCDRPTLCASCAEDHSCCQPDECLKCDAKTTLQCSSCPHHARSTSAWLLACHRDRR